MDDPSPPSSLERGGSEADGPEPALEPSPKPAPSADSSEAGPGRSAAGHDAGDALRAIAHTARSFILYEPSNEKIHDFLEDARRSVYNYLGSYGELRMEMRPWEIVVGGEVIYSDHDREHSLAFRLYRDGVRTLVIAPDLDWNELICLIGILSVRYKGFRTQEDDVVTLLWRADFKHIEYTAVEGVVASEDDASETPEAVGALAGPRTSMQAMIFNAPYAFNYPWPNFTERAHVAYRQVPATLLARFADEDSTEVVPRECLALVKELLAGLADPNDPLTLEDVIPALQETAGFLVGEHRLAELVEMMRAVQRLGSVDESVRKRLFAACADEGVVRRHLLALPADVQQVPPALLELLNLTPGDHLATLLQLFANPSHHASPIVRQLLEGQVRGQASRIADHVSDLEGKAAIELFRVAAKADPAGAVDVAIAFLGRPDEDLHLEALRFLDQVPYGAKIGRALVGALGLATPAVRVRVFALLGRHHERRAFEPLVELVTRSAAADLTIAEAKAAGEALACLDPERARPVFRDWVRPPGLRRLAPGQALLRWAAVSGLAFLPGGETEELLEWLSRHASDDLAHRCTTVLEQLRSQEKAPRV
jgi:hypothetical protein